MPNFEKAKIAILSAICTILLFAICLYVMVERGKRINDTRKDAVAELIKVSEGSMAKMVAERADLQARLATFPEYDRAQRLNRVKELDKKIKDLEAFILQKETDRQALSQSILP